MGDLKPIFGDCYWVYIRFGGSVLGACENAVLSKVSWWKFALDPAPRQPRTLLFHDEKKLVKKLGKQKTKPHRCEAKKIG